MAYQLKALKKEIDILGLYTFFYLEHSKDFYFAGEKHNFWELVYVDAGEISVLADNAGYIINQGEVIFHKPMEFHTLAANKKDPHNVMVITFEARGEAMSFFENKIFSIDRRQKKILSLLLEEAQKAVRYISDNALPLEFKEEEFGTQQLISLYLEQFLVSLVRSNQTDMRHIRKSSRAKKNTENALVESVERYLTDNVQKNLTLQDVCAKFNLGKSYISQLFKETVGKSIIDHYIDLKIAEAKILIRQGDLNFTEIAEKLGYNSIHHFTRSFKSKTGLSPGAYAKSVR